MTQLTVITPPAEEPVTLAAAKDFLRIGHDGEDDLVLRLIASARTRIEQEAGLALVAQTLRVDWFAWPSTLAGRGVLLPRRPVLALTSVEMVSADNVRTDETTRFRLDCGRLGLRPWSQAPVIETGGTAQVTFEAGFGAVDDVPGDLNEAVLRLVGILYNARGPSGIETERMGEFPETVRAILDARREVRL